MNGLEATPACRCTALGTGAVIAASCVMVAQLTVRLLSLPYRIWDNVRVAEYLTVWRGLALYPSESEPAIGWAYGPMTPLILGVVGLVQSADGMVCAAGGLTFVLAIVPLAMLSAHAASRHLFTSLVATSVLAGAALAIPSISEICCVVQLEATGVALLAGAIGLLLFAPHRWSPAAAGVLLALAIWTKQTFLFGAAGVVLFSFVRLDRRRAATLAVATGGASVLLGLLFSGIFGGKALWFWMVTGPSRQPWIELLSGRPWTLQAVAAVTVQQTWVGFLSAASGVVACRWTRASIPEAAGALLCAAVAQLPVAVAGLQKIGGTINHLGVVSLLLVSAGMIMMLAAASRLPHRSWIRSGAFPAVAVAAAVAATVTGLPLNVASRLVAGGPSPLARCTALAAANPGKVYFPWHPLASLIGEGRLYHVDYGLLDLTFSDLEASDDWFFAGLPPQLRYIVSPDPPFTDYVITRLGDRVEPTTDIRIPGFRVFTVRPLPTHRSAP